jgi:hypothetical protein
LGGLGDPGFWGLIGVDVRGEGFSTPDTNHRDQEKQKQTGTKAHSRPSSTPSQFGQGKVRET